MTAFCPELSTRTTAEDTPDLLMAIQPRPDEQDPRGPTDVVGRARPAGGRANVPAVK